MVSEKSLAGFIDPHKILCNLECSDTVKSEGTSSPRDSVNVLMLTLPRWNKNDLALTPLVGLAHCSCSISPTAKNSILVSIKEASPYHKDQKNVSWGGDVNFSSPHGVQNRCCISQPGILYMISRYDAGFLVLSYIEKAWSLSLGNAQGVNLSTLNDSVDRESFGDCSTPKSSRDCSCPACSWKILKPLYMEWIAAYFPTFSRNGVITQEKILEWLSSKVESALHRRTGAAQKTMRDVVQLFHRNVLYDSPMTVQLLCKKYGLPEKTLGQPVGNEVPAQQVSPQNTLRHFFISPRS
ncbi:proteasome beta 5 subunit [Perkinsela sp. CCAP 1560/4]|nr:proteasome beta 5 subunit [Perkinsela sp. CCAP 1560/4]|eukprot:KNH05306.1 proteasome beta 5 subunit [Perkinsela sp. CCAP 1560/4]